MEYTKQQRRSRKTRATSIYIPGIDKAKGKGESLKSLNKSKVYETPFLKMIGKLFRRKV